MPKNRKDKLLVGAWLDHRIVEGMFKWLNLHAGFDQTAFLILAVDEELQKEGIILPRSSIESRELRKATPPTQGKPTEGNSHIAHQETAKHASATALKKPLRRSKVLVKAWVDKSLAGGIEGWLETRSGLQRTDFLHIAVAAKLKRDGISLPRDATIRKQLRTPLPASSYAGVDLSDALLAQIRHLTKEMLRLTGKLQRFQNSKNVKASMERIEKRVRLTRKVIKQLLGIRSRLEQFIEESNRLLEKAARLAKRVALSKAG